MAANCSTSAHKIRPILMLGPDRGELLAAPKTSFLCINQHIPNSRVHKSIPIKRFQMRQKACSQIAVPAPPFVNDYLRGFLYSRFSPRPRLRPLALSRFCHTIVVIGRQGMRQTIVRRRKCLIELAKAPAAQAIEL